MLSTFLGIPGLARFDPHGSKAWGWCHLARLPVLSCREMWETPVGKHPSMPERTDRSRARHEKPKGVGIHSGRNAPPEDIEPWTTSGVDMLALELAFREQR